MKYPLSISLIASILIAPLSLQAEPQIVSPNALYLESKVTRRTLGRKYRFVAREPDILEKSVANQFHQGAWHRLVAIGATLLSQWYKLEQSLEE